MEISGMPPVCIKCRNGLTDEEKKIGLPLCQDCIESLTDTVMGKVRKSAEKKIEREIDNFSRFILSSGELFKLDDITVIQCCFNIFMRETTELGDKDLIVSQKIFRDAIKFIEMELENIDGKMNNRNDNHISSAGNDHLVSMIDELIKKGMKSGNGAENSTIESIEKCIDEGIGKDKYQDDKNKEDKNKEDSKKEDKNKEDSKKEDKNKEDNASSSKRINFD